MKILFSLSFILIFTINLLPQGYYPLQVGNLWQYHNIDPMENYIWQDEIVGDTTLPNGFKYSIFSGISIGTNLLRQENSKVFAYDIAYSTEYLLFDFNAKSNDTISIFHNKTRTIVLRSVIDTLLKKQWNFVEYWGDSVYSYIFYNWTIVDSIGLTNLTIEPGTQYYLTGAKINGNIIGTITNISEQNNIIPDKVMLMQNYPNPFNPSTTIKFILPHADNVELKVYNLLGEEIITLTNMYYSAGEHQIKWNASNISSSIYFYKIKTSHYSETKKLLLLK
jgi:Secretion system C-terminal sorting domain